MAYLFFLSFICLYYKALKFRDIKYSELLVFSIPVIFVWVLMVGGQYAVGTDYFSYIGYFNSQDTSYFDDRRDILFSFFIKFSHSIGAYGQDLFFILSFIWIIVLLLITKNILIDKKIKYIYLFFFVFITYSTSFNNQMNGLRQYTSVYYITLALVLLLKENYRLSIPWFICAVFTHFSSITIAVLGCGLYFLLFVVKSYDKKENIRLLSLIVIGSIITSWLINNISYIEPLIYKLREAEMFDDYTVYYNNMTEMHSGFDKITKYIYAPIILYAISKIKYMNLSYYENRLFIFGILSYSLKILVTGIPFVSRLGAYFEVLMCIPIIYLLIYSLRTNKTTVFLFVLFYLILPYSMKVTYFAINEYTYHSIFFK